MTKEINVIHFRKDGKRYKNRHKSLNRRNIMVTFYLEHRIKKLKVRAP